MEKLNIDYDGKLIQSRFRFFEDKGHKLLNQINEIVDVFEVSYDEIYLYFYYDIACDIILYYGCSTQKLDTKEFSQRVGNVVMEITFEDYIEIRDALLVNLENRKAAASIPPRNMPGQAGSIGIDFGDDEEEDEEDDSIAEPKVIKTIRDFLDTVPFRDFYQSVSKRVIGQENLKVVLANIYNYLQNIAKEKPDNNNMILTAPSGCGKTETYRAVKEFFAKELPVLPVAQIDLTGITEEGFRGKSTKDIVMPLLQRKETNGIGILFLDEFDKKMIPSYTSGNNNVNQAVQSQLLTLLEGTEFYDKQDHINTGNTLFIGLGSFDECRKRREEKPNTIGFGALLRDETDHFDKITREDMISLGAIYEFLGRFPLITNYYRLEEEAVDRIIEMIVRRLEESYDVSIRLSSGMRKKLHENANSEYGCRLLDSMLREAVMDGFIEVLMSQRRGKITLDLEADGKVNVIWKNADSDEEQEAC